MAFEAILHEVEQLHHVSKRLEGLAEPVPVSTLVASEMFARRLY